MHLLILLADSETAVIGEFMKLGLSGAMLVVAGFVIRSMYRTKEKREAEFHAQRDAWEKRMNEMHAERIADMRATMVKQTEITQQVTTALTNSSSVMDAQNQAVHGLKDALSDMAEDLRKKR